MLWKPPEFTVGDRVVNPSHPQWGVGTVVDAQGLGEIFFNYRNTLTKYVFDRKCQGQRLAVRFEDGRTRTINSSTTLLKPA